MSAVGALIRHELTRWRGLWAVAGACLLLVLASPLLPGFESHPVADVWGVAGLIVGIVYGLGAALLLGLDLLGTDAVRGRLGFYLALPVPAGTLWWTRVGVAVACLLGSLAIVTAPALGALTLIRNLDFPGVPATVDSGRPFLLVLFAVPVLLLAFSHLLGLGVRARTPWLAVDVLGLVATVAGMVGTVWGLLGAGAADEGSILTWLYAGLAIGALLVAGWRQLRDGGVEVSRLARLGSIWSWGILLLGTGAGAALCSWWLDVGPEELQLEEIYQVGPDHAVVWGSYRGRPSYRPALLISGPGDRFSELGRFWPGRLDRIEVARDRMLLPGRDFQSFVRLGPEGGEVVQVGNLPRSYVSAIAPEGDRIAVAERGRILVAEAPDWRVVRVIEVPRSLQPAELRFLGSDELLWISGGYGDRLREIRRFDRPSGQLLSSTSVPTDVEEGSVQVDPTGQLALVRRAPMKASLHDARTGVQLRTLEEFHPFRWTFAAGGELVVLGSGPEGGARGGGWIRVFQPDGSIGREQDLPVAEAWTLAGGSIDGGVFLVATTDEAGEGGPGTRLVSFDPSSGDLRGLARLSEEARPVAGFWKRYPLHAVYLQGADRSKAWRYDPSAGTLDRIF